MNGSDVGQTGSPPERADRISTLPGSWTMTGLVCVSLLLISCDDGRSVANLKNSPASGLGAPGSRPILPQMGLDEAIGALRVGPPSIARPVFLHDGPGGLCVMTERTRLASGSRSDPAVIASLKGFEKVGIDAVARLFQETDPTAHAAAAMALAELDSESSSTLERLQTLLVAPVNPVVRAYAANAFVFLGVRAIPILTQHLEWADAEINQSAAFALGLIGSAASSAAKPLARALESSRADAGGHNHVGAACAFALRRIGLRGLGETLAVLKRSTAPCAAMAASAVLIPLDRKEAAEAAVLIAGSVDGATSEARVLLGELLSKFPGAGAEVRSALGLLLTDPLPRVRLAGGLAWARTQADPEAGILLLTSLLGDSSASVRRGAAATLGQLGTRSASSVQRLLEMLQDEGSEVRAAAATALIEIQPDPAALLTPLARLLSDKDRLVSDAAARALAKVGQLALPVLATSLKDASPEARRGGAVALGQLHGVPGAVAALIGAVADQSVDVRRVVVSALRRQAERPLDGRGKRGISPALAAVPVLLECLKDEDGIVREEAAGAIGNVGPGARSAAAALLARLKDGNGRVRRAAALALEEVGYQTPEVVPVLVEVMNDPGLSEAVRERAARMLFEIDPEAARGPSRR